VQHVAAAGDMTFARLSRLSGLGTGCRCCPGDSSNSTPRRRKGCAGRPRSSGRMRFARFDAPVEEMLARFGANHIHVVPGDRVGELRAVCRLLDVDFDGFGALG